MELYEKTIVAEGNRKPPNKIHFPRRKLKSPVSLSLVSAMLEYVAEFIGL